ncbi:ABC transporter ATP-binding protein [Brevibacillus fulvus]|uniref:Iron complex transport system ATP-binding protein n=1 Tax=Brevibacillus fulvus TaxID=1125967 RepID=A0A939BTQ0_9BACL|nr:ABC transporter ATP-binding protein [Brevibacillus fulvus]MBM7589699.1 iron complex transport system ATP-binding protein [Brevibacillus fulvus]
MNSLQGKALTFSYGETAIIKELDVEIPKGKITTIIGPNGCGKSTLLKTLARIVKPTQGSIYLNMKELSQMSTKEIAKQMAILPQIPEAPSGLTVYELVSYGRFPHQKGFGTLTTHDRRMIEWALRITGTIDFQHRTIEALSGGQRQRVWIAMALAQETELILLDEPTTYLDLAHQLEVLEILYTLNRQEERTIVMVLHDLNHAARFADHLIAMRDGQIICEGDPHQVMTREHLRTVFQIEAQIVEDPRLKRPICLTYDLINTKNKQQRLG